MTRPSIGVALCTYNGERYVRDQLRSIVAQRRPPDLLVACDDASQDATVALLEAAAAQAPFPLRIVRNSANLGFLRNFEQAIARCDADIVVLSDQDDFWREDKVERIEAAFRDDGALGGVFSDAQIVDEALQPMGYGLMDVLNVDLGERAAAGAGRTFPVLLRRNIVAGATLAFRAKWKERLLPIPEGAVHDAWIALMLAAHGSLRFIPERLILYRQHGANQIGARRASIREQLRSMGKARRAENRQSLSLTRELHRRLSADGDAPLAALALVAAKIAHLERRVLLPGSRLMRLRAIVAEFVSGRYSRYSSGWRTAMRDLLSPM